MKLSSYYILIIIIGVIVLGLSFFIFKNIGGQSSFESLYEDAKNPDNHEDVITVSSKEKGSFISIGGWLAARELIVTQEIKSNSLSGNGNAYLCVDKEGKFFRSEKACV